MLNQDLDLIIHFSLINGLNQLKRINIKRAHFYNASSFSFYLSLSRVCAYRVNDIRVANPRVARKKKE